MFAFGGAHRLRLQQTRGSNGAIALRPGRLPFSLVVLPETCSSLCLQQTFPTCPSLCLQQAFPNCPSLCLQQTFTSHSAHCVLPVALHFKQHKAPPALLPQTPVPPHPQCVCLCVCDVGKTSLSISMGLMEPRREEIPGIPRLAGLFPSWPCFALSSLMCAVWPDGIHPSPGHSHSQQDDAALLKVTEKGGRSTILHLLMC